MLIISLAKRLELVTGVVIVLFCFGGCTTPPEFIGRTIAISGWVNHPGEYNIRLAKEASVADIIKAAGGHDNSIKGLRAVLYKDKDQTEAPIATVKGDQY